MNIFINNKKSTIIILLLLSFLLLLYMVLNKPPLLSDISFSRMVLDRNGNLMRLSLSSDEKYRLYTPINEVSLLLKESILLYEDKYFYKHIGINPIALARAFAQTYLSNSRRVGGSTITMQVARIKFNLNSSNIGGKLWQIIKALQLEYHYSKDEILEAYLNLLPFGSNIEGVGAASYIYLGRKAKDLNLLDSLSLAVIPQNPIKRSPRKNGLYPKALEARRVLYKEWLKSNPNDIIYRSLLDLPMKFNNAKALPFIAPHLSLNLLASHLDNQITTSLDKNLQFTLEKQIDIYIKANSDYGVKNSSAMLIDFTTMEVLAYVGSANFYDNTIDGQVDGTRAKRSPGSTLKPFIYALAFDQGIAHPMTLLKDSPQQYGNYFPENFDSAFMGPISARESLIKSRNVPVLYLAAKLNKPNFYEFLEYSKISKLRKADEYGLSLALGSAEVTMEELIELYAMLANFGIYQKIKKILRPLQGGGGKTIRDTTRQTELHLSTHKDSCTDSISNSPINGQRQETYINSCPRLLSKESSYLTLDILKDVPRPGLNNSLATNQLPVYWKTGTSSAFRDSWAIGISGKYLLAVWVGDFKGKIKSSFIGIKTAAPLFFNILDAILAEETHQDIILDKFKELNISKVSVCADTGDIKTDLCPIKTETWFIPGKSPIKDTGIYRKVLIDKGTGQQACTFQEGKTEYKIISFWPSDLLELYKKAGINKSTPPPYSATCGTINYHNYIKPQIISPLKHVTYSIRNNNKITLTATTDAATEEIFWFINDELVGRSHPTEPLLWEAKPGKIVIRAVDNNGKSDTRVIIVEN